MSAVRLLDEVSRVLHDLDATSAEVTEQRNGTVVVRPPMGLSAAGSSWWCQRIAEALTKRGFHCTRSRTRVRVRREPATLGLPDFVHKRSADHG